MLLFLSTGTAEYDFVRCLVVRVLPFLSSVAVLSEVSGSNTPEVVLAVLEMFVVREESTFTTRVTDLLAPQVTRLRFSPSPPSWRVLSLKAETKLAPAGIASDRLTPLSSVRSPVASDCLLFVLFIG